MIQSTKSSYSRFYSSSSVETIINTLFDQHGIHVTNRIGNELNIFCLFHENFHSPAMSINVKTGLWQCFNPSCGKKGNLRQLYRHLTGKSLSRELTIDPDELQREIDKGFQEDSDESLSIDSIKIDYESDDVSLLSSLFDRGYTKQSIIDFEIGYSKIKNRVVIPVRDISYNLIGFIGRAVDSDQSPKYLYNKGFKRKDVLFNLQNAKYYDSVIICEGSLDCIKVHQAGFKNVVATLGAKVSDPQIRLMRRFFDSIMIFSDNDDAGRSMRDGIIDGCRGKEIFQLDIPEGLKDPGDMTEKQIQQSIENKKYI